MPEYDVLNLQKNKSTCIGAAKKPILRVNFEFLLGITAVITAIIYMIFIISPVLSLFAASGIKNMSGILSDSHVRASIRISFSTSIIAVFFIFILSTPAVIILFSLKKNIGARIIEVIISLPLVFPPAVAGLGLLTSFGKNGLLGRLLARLGFEVVFTPAAVIMAQIFVASAFYVQILGTALNSVETEIFEVSGIQGAGKVYTYIFIIIPMLKKDIAAGLITAWARALGEFGATIMFAGNVPEKTQTLPLAIYTAMQSDIEVASAISIIIFSISFITLFTVKSYISRNT